MRRRWWVLLVGAFLFVLMCLGILPGEPVGRLLVGWGLYPARVWPAARVNWGMVGLGVGCGVGVIVSCHWLSAWLWRERRGGQARQWRKRWTLAVVGVVVLMFVSGIAAAVIVHQVAWLARSERPLFTHRAVHAMRCESNMDQIGVALGQYAKGNGGRLPDTLAPLLLTQDIDAWVFVCPLDDRKPAPGATPEEQAKHLAGHLSYVYHGAGLTTPVPADRVVLIEPLANHEGRVNVLFGDGRVKWMTEAEAREAMRRM